MLREKKKKKKREIEGFTGVRCSNSGCSRKVAGPLTLPLEVAVHGVVTVGPNGVGKWRRRRETMEAFGSLAGNGKEKTKKNRFCIW